MRGYSSSKPSFPFGASFNKYTSSVEDIGDYGASLYEVLCSWLSFRDFRPVGSIAEVEKKLNVFSAMFHANHKQMVKKHKKTKCKEIPQIVKIDLNKIDENLKLSNNEKRRLKRTLHQIKYREFSAKANKKDVKRGNNKSVVLRKPKKTVDKNTGRNKKLQSVEKSKERLSWQRSECKHCSLCSKVGNETVSKWNERNRVTNISSSEERIFKTLMNLDRSCCGESFKKLFDQKGRKTFITQNHNINIENIELKYIQPTCLMQYKDLQRTKTLSSVALDGHLGAGACPSIRNIHSHGQSGLIRQKTIHYDDDSRNSPILSITNPPIPTSELTDIMKENDAIEGKTSTLPKQQRLKGKISGDFDLEKHIESLKAYRDKWTEDDGSLERQSYQNFMDCDNKKIMPSQQTLEELEKNEVIPSRAENKYQSNCEKPNGLRKNTSKCQKFKNFAKKCFCICGSENDSETDLLRESGRYREVRSDRVRKRLNSPNVKVKRMTEEEFLMSEERITGQVTFT